MVNIQTPDGPAATVQGGTVYVKKLFDWSRFVWAGEYTFIGDTSDGGAGINITTKADARNGGIQRDGVMLDPPANVTATLSMKRVRGDRLKTNLRNCFWIVDKRTQCSDFDSHLKWEEIERIYYAKAGPRTISPGTAITGANADDMVTFPVTALGDVDIYRLHAESAIGIVAVVTEILSADISHGERCIGCGDDETDCVIVAGTGPDAANPHILVNANGGAVGSWTDITVTEWAVNGINGITSLGNWGGAVSNGEAEVLHTNDLFTTRVNYDTVDIAANPPNDIDASSQSFVVVVGDTGYIYISRDGLSTIETSNAGTVTTQDLTRVKIAPSNSRVVYAWALAADAIVKTENGGETWFQVALTGTAGGIASLGVHKENSNMVLVGTDVGEVFQSTDGGETWTEQSEIPGLTTKATTVIEDIKPGGGGVWFLAANDPAVVEHVYVNYEDGANGAWEYFNPIDNEEYIMLENPKALAPCGPNRCVVVGGDGAANDMVGLLA